MVRSRLQLPLLVIGPSHRVRRWDPRKPNGSVLQVALACAAPARSGVGASSARLVAAKPMPVAISAVTRSVPAIARRQNPVGVVRAALVVVSWIWLVFVEVFMALIVYPAMTAQ